MERTLLRLKRLDPPYRCCASSYTSRVARVSQQPAAEETPPLDPEAVPRAYRFHRARREARERRHRERRWASLRFWLVFTLVLAAAAFLAARTLGEIERIFGL
jgi:anti-sigma-K factor RskA